MILTGRADAERLFHFAFMLFAVMGALAVPRRWSMRSGILMIRGVCPMTPRENDLRLCVGSPGYAGSFVDPYLMPLIYPRGLTPSLQRPGA